MNNDRALLIAFLGLGLLAVATLGNEWLFQNTNDPIDSFVSEGGLQALGAAIFLAGAFFVTRNRMR